MHLSTCMLYFSPSCSIPQGTDLQGPPQETPRPSGTCLGSANREHCRECGGGRSGRLRHPFTEMSPLELLPSPSTKDRCLVREPSSRSALSRFPHPHPLLALSVPGVVQALSYHLQASTHPCGSPTPCPSLVNSLFIKLSLSHPL